MTDQAVVHIGENSPQQVAYKLMQRVMDLEGKSFNKDWGQVPDRKWLLDTYAECLRAVTNPLARK